MLPPFSCSHFSCVSLSFVRFQPLSPISPLISIPDRNQRAGVVALDCIQSWAEAFPKDILSCEDAPTPVVSPGFISPPHPLSHYRGRKHILASPKGSSKKRKAGALNTGMDKGPKATKAGVAGAATGSGFSPPSELLSSFSEKGQKKSKPKRVLRVKSNFALVYSELRKEDQFAYQAKGTYEHPPRLPILTMKSVINDKALNKKLNRSKESILNKSTDSAGSAANSVNNTSADMSNNSGMKEAAGKYFLLALVTDSFLFSFLPSFA
jgi:hypothetical protein